MNLNRLPDILVNKRHVGVGDSPVKKFSFSYLGHLINFVFALTILGTGGGQGIELSVLRSMYVLSVAFAVWLVFGKRRNFLFLARTLILILPGYYAAGVQLCDPALYYSHFERVSQTLDISMTMYALSSLALLGSEIGLWRGSVVKGYTRTSSSLSDDFFFYIAIGPFIAVSYYVSLMYGKTLFVAGYASEAGASGLGVTTAIGSMLAFVMFQNFLIKPRFIKGLILTACMMYFLIFSMLIRGGRQDVISCLFGLYVIYWGQKRDSAPISGHVAIVGVIGFVFMEFMGFIRGNILTAGFDYVAYFGEFVRASLHPGGVVAFGTISPIASTFSNTVYALKTGLVGHIWGKGYLEYILRTPPEFLYPDRPTDYAWIFQNWQLSAGGGFFELAEAYLNLGVIGVIIAPMVVSFYIARVFSRYIREASMLDSFLLFGILCVFLRGALYQTFAFYKVGLAALILMWIFSALSRLRSSGRVVPVKMGGA